MKKILISGLVVAAALTATPAAAQADASADWTGLYAGVRAGYGFQPSDNDETIRFDTNLDGQFGDTVMTGTGANAFSPGFCGGAALTSEPTGGCDDDEDGFEFAAQLGYDRQIGNFVIGLVGDYGRSDLTDSVAAFSTTPAFYTMTRRLRDNASLRARAGVAFNDTLVYATGGLAWGKIRNSFSTSNTANVFTNTGNEDAWGYRLGGGIEQRLGRNFSIGVQYLYTSLKDEDFRVRAQGPAPAGNAFLRSNPNGTDFARSGERFTSHGVQAVMNFRF